MTAVVGAGWDLVDQPPPHRTLLFLVRSINVGLLDGFSIRIVEYPVANGDLPVHRTLGLVRRITMRNYCNDTELLPSQRSPFHAGRKALSDNRVTESTAKPTSPAACPKYRPVGWSVTVDLHKATRNYRPCHSEQTRHGDKNWKHNHAIAGVLPRHPAESSTGSSLGVLRRRGVVGNDSLRAYARDPQGRWHHYRLSFKSLQGRHR